MTTKKSIRMLKLIKKLYRLNLRDHRIENEINRILKMKGL
jgi:hypothetical protein